jgi:uncharacterized protein (DUF1330 family)
MPAYFISDGFVKDREALKIFRERAAASVSRYGGRYLVRAGAVEPVEGTWKPHAIVVIEFPDIERARAWYRSAEYASALAVRDQAIGRQLILVEGLSPRDMEDGTFEWL